MFEHGTDVIDLSKQIKSERKKRKKEGKDMNYLRDPGPATAK
jgi:hypothetical protein